MTILQWIVGIVFVIILIGFFIGILYFAFRKQIVRFKLWFNQKKLLRDEKTIEFCVNRIEEGKTPEEVKTELILSNKYRLSKVNQIMYVFDKIRKEMTGFSEQKGVRDDLP